jgi:chitodextrinase
MKTKNNVAPGSAALRTALAFFTAILLFAACEDATKPSDLTPPAEVGNLNAAPGNRLAVLTWTDPADADFDHVEIAFIPEAAGVDQPITVAKGTQSRSITGLVNETEYTFTVKTVDATENKSAGVSATTTPEEPTVADTTPPAEAGSLNVVPGNGQAILTWINPADVDFDYVEIAFVPAAAGIEQPITVSGGTQVRIVTGLVNGTEYTFTMKTVDTTGNQSAGVSAAATPRDITPPAEVTGLNAAPGNMQAVLTWTDPADEDFARVEITFTPEAAGIEQPIMVTEAQTYTVTGLANGTEYAFTLKTADATGNQSAGISVATTPNLANVSGLTAVPGNAQAILTWIDPAVAELDHLEITLSPTAGSGDPIIVAKGTETHTVTGLVNGTAYFFTVKAVDTAGNKSPGVTATTTPAGPSALNTIEQIEAALAGADGGSSADDPVSLTAALDLTSDWANLLNAIQTANKYVELDLTACTMAGMTAIEGEFDPVNANTNSGKGLITSLTLPSAATSIKSATGIATTRTFRYFDNLKTVGGSAVTAIGVRAFSSLNSLTTVSFPAVTAIGNYAFYDCKSSALTAVAFPAAITIGSYAFAGCSFLVTASFPNVGTIGANAFQSCTSLTTLSFPKATTINNYAFQVCSVLDTVSLSEVTTIGGYAFQNCANLTTVTFPKAVSIGETAFRGCSSLITVSIPLAATIGNFAFRDCSSLVAVSFPEASSIGNSVFWGCSSLTTASFPKLVSFGNYPFLNTGGGTALAITLPQTAPTLASTSFASDDAYAKTVTVKTPAGRTEYDETWESNFKLAFGNNATIALTIEDL